MYRSRYVPFPLSRNVMHQVLSDLSTAAGELGLGPRPLNVTLAPGSDDKDDDDDDDDDENKEEGEVIMVSVKDGLSGEISNTFFCFFRRMTRHMSWPLKDVAHDINGFQSIRWKRSSRKSRGVLL